MHTESSSTTKKTVIVRKWRQVRWLHVPSRRNLHHSQHSCKTMTDQKTADTKPLYITGVARCPLLAARRQSAEKRHYYTCIKRRKFHCRKPSPQATGRTPHATSTPSAELHQHPPCTSPVRHHCWKLQDNKAVLLDTWQCTEKYTLGRSPLHSSCALPGPSVRPSHHPA